MATPIIRAATRSANAASTYAAQMARWRASVPKEFLPTKTAAGRWEKPKFSAMKIARLRREVLLSGAEWKWDKPKKEVPLVVMKGRKHELHTAERWKTIEENMKGMDKRIEEYRKASRARRPRRNNFLWILENA